jgi:ryanodine receptor 2
MCKVYELIIMNFIINYNIFNNITAYTQQIIINSSEELLKDPFLPLAERVKKRTETLYHKEESLRGFIKSSTDDTSQVLY